MAQAQSIRTLIRKSLINLIKDQVYSSNGYNITPKIVTDLITSHEQMNEYPFYQVYFSNEDYATARTGQQSSGILEKEISVIIEGWNNVLEDPQQWRDDFIADMEKLFDTFYMLPAYNNSTLGTVRDLRLVNNYSFGGSVNLPKIGVGVTLQIYYGQEQGSPDRVG